MTKQDSSLVSGIDYYPNGEKLGMSGTNERFSFTGKEYVEEYGFNLYYYGARFMDPVLGRFVTPDPLPDYLNPYSYVGNNPVNRTDPTGMRGIDSPNIGIHQGLT